MTNAPTLLLAIGLMLIACGDDKTTTVKTADPAEGAASLLADLEEITDEMCGCNGEPNCIKLVTAKFDDWEKNAIGLERLRGDAKERLFELSAKLDRCAGL